MDRYSGYLRAMMFAGLTVEEGWLVDDRDSSGKYLTQLTLPQPLPTAFVCNNDQVAMRLVAQLEAMGVRVPQDISVTGFDNFIYATLCVPALTTYTVDQERMAQVAIRRLQSRIRWSRGSHSHHCRRMGGGTRIHLRAGREAGMNAKVNRKWAKTACSAGGDAGSPF